MHPAGPDPSRRRAELLSSLGDFRARLHDACAVAGRGTREITVIAVTKLFPLADARTLLELGVADLGESRDQEARAKAAALPAARWHFVGRLQTNKARSVASYANAVHSVDRPDLVRALADGVLRAARPALPVFVQVSLDGDPARGGTEPGGVLALAEQVSASEQLSLAGVMAVAPLGEDPATAFARLASVSADLRAQFPQAGAISAGMSADLEAAVAAGATHVRVGTALLGPRAPVVG